ncbi:Helicase associated domain-containing protein [Streptomyces sp. 2133.1]|uniref:helicase associated domain-containing protein n=1 Tax=Streptomyces sp. 2321.6 TaxID=1938840 RepID=UPI00089A87A8|nr:MULTISPECIES: helicase associated domain-containing protein [unclassified Streptomyces]SEB66084.1 Helicase associated domain-containing protein [Streptomyces sp. 2133.1]SNC59290.1 Helicase associated domain-containing protein [Streptomyces sp. 2114.4]
MTAQYSPSTPTPTAVPGGRFAQFLGIRRKSARESPDQRTYALGLWALRPPTTSTASLNAEDTIPAHTPRPPRSNRSFGLSANQQHQVNHHPAQQAPSEPHPAAKRAAKGQGKAQHAFQRGLAALAQWMEQEGGQPPHKAVVALPEGTETKVGVWYANQKQRRYKLTEEQLEALRALGVQWA